MYEAGDIIIYGGQMYTVLSNEEVVRYHGPTILGNVPIDAVWAYYRGTQHGPMYVEADGVHLASKANKRTRVKRNLPDWF